MHTIEVSVVQVGEPEAPIVSSTDAQDFLRLQQGQDDVRIKALIAAATAEAERYTWRSLVKKNYVQYMSAFPRHHLHEHYISPLSNRVYVRDRWADRAIDIWYPPLISVTNLVYVGLDGVEHTMLPGQDFQVDVASEPGGISPLPQQIWPYTMYGVKNPVRIAFTAGYEVQASDRPDSEAGNVSEPETESTSSGAPTPPDQVVSYTAIRTVPENVVLAILHMVAHWYQNREPVIQGSIATLPSMAMDLLNSERCFNFAPEGHSR